jgi:hypothetical protein
MPTFSPPTFSDMPLYVPGSEKAKLYRYYPSHNTGYVVWKDQNDIWHQDTVAYHGNSRERHYDGVHFTETGPDSGIGNAKVVYLGGHVYALDEAATNELIAAGYGDYIDGIEIERDIYFGGNPGVANTNVYSGGSPEVPNTDVYSGGTP